MPKIISECCELVKLCDINCSGPVFFETHCILYIKLDACFAALKPVDYREEQLTDRILSALEQTGLRRDQSDCIYEQDQ